MSVNESTTANVNERVKAVGFTEVLDRGGQLMRASRCSLEPDLDLVASGTGSSFVAPGASIHRGKSVAIYFAREDLP